MKRCFTLMLCLMLLASFIGCAKEEAGETETGAAGQAEEMADTTRLDSAAGMIDSLAGEVEEAAEEAVEEAVEEVTGH